MGDDTMAGKAARDEEGEAKAASLLSCTPRPEGQPPEPFAPFAPLGAAEAEAEAGEEAAEAAGTGQWD